ERGKGFRFAPTGKQEFLDLTAIVIALESLALRCSPPAARTSAGTCSTTSPRRWRASWSGSPAPTTAARCT
ncbi:hypothetical protein ABZW03_23780, partial [Kitasatospora sp. NPDC004799]